MADDQARNPESEKEKPGGQRPHGRGETGITNRPLDEEEANQDAIPDRGERKGDTHA